MCTKGKRVIFTVPFFYMGSDGRGPSRERTCYPRTKFSPVSVHSSLEVLHFAEKETGDHLVVSLYKKTQENMALGRKIICNCVFTASGEFAPPPHPPTPITHSLSVSIPSD